MTLTDNPRTFLTTLEKEEGINAIAAGYRPSDAVVAVTRRSMENLSRAELHGVVAHEFSHILNGDMRLNIRLIGFLYGIMVIANIGQAILRSTRSSSSKEGSGIHHGHSCPTVSLPPPYIIPF